MTDYNTSITRDINQSENYDRNNLNRDNYDTDVTKISNLLWTQNVSVNIVDK